MPLVEFAANNQASETTGVSPFFANYGYDLWWTDDATDKPQRTANNSPKAREGRSHAEAMKEINEHLQSEMLRA